MNKVLRLLMLSGLSGLCVFAEGAPVGDVFVGFSILQPNSGLGFTAKGGVGALALDFNNYFAVEAEFGGYHHSNVNNLQYTSYSVLAGPRGSYGRTRIIDPYAHALFGGIHATTSVPRSLPLPGLQYHEESSSKFAMAVGAGIDIKLNDHILLRAAQIDYYLTQFHLPGFLVASRGSSTKHPFQYSFGVTFSLGGEY